ncbi:helix-turn-helix domain-containing protein [Pseudoruegeria sp. HB172150]|uniref:helix-turn-helix domain-containing protein n=1 Tax=Pseudoruegeria sp. HB172150 TaxID=2721164 RepID=UPI0015557CBF|nr:helix-turn-helix domain-containing protein [Pseudoruegeria sp. HB172150]
MPTFLQIQSNRRTSISVHRLRSPLTRVGYSLRQGFAQLLLVSAGRVWLRAGPEDTREPIDAPRLVWLADGAGEELLAEGGTRATIVSIAGLALTGALPATPLGEQMQRTLGQDLSFPLEKDGRIGGLVEGLDNERTTAEPGADIAAGLYLSLLLVQIWRLARADLVAHGRAPQGLAERFVLLAGQRVREHLKVTDYAHALGISRDRLGSAVRKATGLSPQAYLHQLLIREASDLLASTGMPVGQVAYRLGFPDPAYFTRFFTRHRGESPAQFRRAAKARRAAGDVSYAAWP